MSKNIFSRSCLDLRTTNCSMYWPNSTPFFTQLMQSGGSLLEAAVASLSLFWSTIVVLIGGTAGYVVKKLIAD